MTPRRSWSPVFVDTVPIPADDALTYDLEAGFRYSSLDLSDGDVDGGEMDTYSLGLNWWLTLILD